MGVTLPPIIEEHLSWWIAGAIVVLGLLVYGFVDVARLSLKRAWAISGVCFDDSIRRRVLWITPLAILGVVIIAQLQRPLDEQDAIRQTIKICLFATGLVVVVTTIILACTSLPKDIETRVIYTVVTKPTTRLEIVLGKVIGFARVSATILLIMGVFTAGYLYLRAYALQRGISERLATGSHDPTLEYWAKSGLLNSRSLLNPKEASVYSREPQPSDPRRWLAAGGEQTIVVPFELSADDLIPLDAPDPHRVPGSSGVQLRLNIGFDARNVGKQEDEPAEQTTEPAATKTGPATTNAPVPVQLTVQILDRSGSTVVQREQINDGEPITLTDPTGATPVRAYIKPEVAVGLANVGTCFVEVIGVTPGAEYFVESTSRQDPKSQPIVLVVPPLAEVYIPAGGTRPHITDEMRKIIAPPVNPRNEYQLTQPMFQSRQGTYGQQLRGGAPGQSPVAVISFNDDGTGPEMEANDGRVPFELRVGVERGGDEIDAEAATRLELVIFNKLSGKRSDPIYVQPESNRTSYFDVTSDAVDGGKFEVYLRNLTTGNYIGLRDDSLAMVLSTQSFASNLFKSLLILWLLTILVVIISIFCSTFLSWPIAIVLTLVVLLGNWAVLQLGEDTGPGIGNSIATEMGIRDPSVAKTMGRSVDALAKFLNVTAHVLPDISRFAAVEDIERGVTIDRKRLTDPLIVLASFGLPLFVLAYVILRNKEVAP